MSRCEGFQRWVFLEGLSRVQKDSGGTLEGAGVMTERFTNAGEVEGCGGMVHALERFGKFRKL